jgi:hypothetical protein
MKHNNRCLATVDFLTGYTEEEYFLTKNKDKINSDKRILIDLVDSYFNHYFYNKKIKKNGLDIVFNPVEKKINKLIKISKKFVGFIKENGGSVWNFIKVSNTAEFKKSCGIIKLAINKNMLVI